MQSTSAIVSNLSALVDWPSYLSRMRAFYFVTFEKFAPGLHCRVSVVFSKLLIGEIYVTKCHHKAKRNYNFAKTNGH